MRNTDAMSQPDLARMSHQDLFVALFTEEQAVNYGEEGDQELLDALQREADSRFDTDAMDRLTEHFTAGRYSVEDRIAEAENDWPRIEAILQGCA